MCYHLHLHLGHSSVDISRVMCIMCCNVLYCHVMCYIVLYCVIMCYIVLYCVIMCYTIMTIPCVFRGVFLCELNKPSNIGV